MRPRSPLLLLCASTAANTCAVGAFPALLPELAADAGLADWELGLVAGAWGFARMVADVPVGLFITHHLRRALVAGPLVLAVGALVLATGGPFPALVLGRWLMGTGHALAMLGGLTAILRHAPAGVVASWLNAFEFSAMLGMVGGVGILALLPRGLAWNAAFLVTSAPIAASAALAPALLGALPRGLGAGAPWFARSERRGRDAPHGPGRAASWRGPGGEARGARPSAAAGTALGVLAFVAGGAVAVSYSSVEQFAIPLRGSRDFDLDRVGIARLLLLLQASDVVALLPVGALADRYGAPRLLGLVLLAFAVGLGLIGFGALPLVVAGTALFGLAMAGWMLPLGLLRAVTPPDRVAWRLALYRVSVDGGIFLGPFASGLLAARAVRLLPAALAALLALLGVVLLAASGRGLGARAGAASTGRA